MARIRRIERSPATGKNYYVVDANVLANYAIPLRAALTCCLPSGELQRATARIKACHDWWDEIQAQMDVGKARVYVPDVCIAEAFKVLAKFYYRHRWWDRRGDYDEATQKLRRLVTMSHEEMKRVDRLVKCHDLSTNRDIVIAVDRFFEPLFRRCKNVQVADLILLASTKYLLDFYDLPRDRVYIVTMDRPVWELARAMKDLPATYDPSRPVHAAARIFK